MARVTAASAPEPRSRYLPRCAPTSVRTGARVVTYALDGRQQRVPLPRSPARVGGRGGRGPPGAGARAPEPRSRNLPRSR